MTTSPIPLAPEPTDAKKHQRIPTITAYESSVSLDVTLAISAGRVEALSDMLHGRAPNEERAFARTTIAEAWRPVFAMAYREQTGMSAAVEP